MELLYARLHNIITYAKSRDKQLETQTESFETETDTRFETFETETRKTGLETRLQTETKPRDSITGA